MFLTNFNDSICAYRVFYLPIFIRIEGGGGIHPPPRSLRYRKKRGPESVKYHGERKDSKKKKKR